MIVTVPEFTNNVEKYLSMVEQESIVITKEGKEIATLASTRQCAMDTIRSMRGMLSDNSITLDTIRNMRLSKYDDDNVPDCLLHNIDANRERINAHRPLSATEVRELDAYYRIGATYASNALEGNSLTLTETKVLLEDGITIGGKPVRELYEATGHAKAFDAMLAIARAGDLHFNEQNICELHRLFYAGIDADQAGRYRDHRVFITGTEYMPPAPEDVPDLMRELVDDLNGRVGAMHPVLLAAYAHRRLVDIHPFTDGNGRTARLLMNLVLANTGYCVLSIPPVLRIEYVQALVAAQRIERPTEIPFDTLIAQCELEAQRDYGRMFGIEMARYAPA